MSKFDYSMDEGSLIPLYHQLKAIIKKEIQAGKWRPEDMIPTELEFMEYYSISRTTVRQALTDLVKENLLYRKKGVGTFVAKPKIDLQYMSNIVSFNSQIQSAGLTPSTEVIKLDVITADDNIKSEMGLTDEDKVIELIRVRYAEQEPLAVARSYLPCGLCGFIMEYDMEKESLYQTLALRESTRIVRVQRLVEAQLASSEDCKLMKLEKGFPIQSFINKAYNGDGAVIEYCISHYRGDRNKFFVEMEIAQG